MKIYKILPLFKTTTSGRFDFVLSPLLFVVGLLVTLVLLLPPLVTLSDFTAV